MPVTAKFSEKFYKTLGHGLVDELVDWCNQVDASYRSEFKGLFDARFGQLEAKIEQRFAEADAKMTRGLADLRVEFRTEIARMETRLTLRMFLFWVGSVGLFFAEKL